MPKSRGWTWSKWFTCAQCGFDYPYKYAKRQNGLLRCTYLPCYDETPSKGDPRSTVELGSGERADGNTANAS